MGGREGEGEREGGVERGGRERERERGGGRGEVGGPGRSKCKRVKVTLPDDKGVKHQRLPSNV